MSEPVETRRTVVQSNWGEYILIEEICDCDDDYIRAIEIIEAHLAGVRDDKFQSSGTVNDGTPTRQNSRQPYQETQDAA